MILIYKNNYFLVFLIWILLSMEALGKPTSSRKTKAKGRSPAISQPSPPLKTVPKPASAPSPQKTKPEGRSAPSQSPEQLIGTSALKLNNQQQFGSKGAKVNQRFNETLSETQYYFVTETKGRKLVCGLNSNGSKDIDKKVLVIKDAKDELDLSDDHRTGYTVLKLDESIKRHSSYWIFKAYLREASSTDSKADVLEVNGKKMVIEWGSWDEEFIFSSFNSNGAGKGGSCSSKVVHNGRGFGQKGRKAKVSEENFATEDPMDASKSSEELKTKEKPRVVTAADASEPSDEYSSFEQTDEERLQKERIEKQKQRLKEMKADKETQPEYINLIKSDQDIYAHVRWYDDYVNDTTIDPDNIFSSHSFGQCAAKELKLRRLTQATATRDIVDFFSALLRDYCKPSALVFYNKLFEDGYIALNPDRSISIAKDKNKLLMKKTPTIAEADQLMRMYIIAAYSQVYISVMTYPMEPIDPHRIAIESRVFILVNAVLHIQDLLVKHSIHHFRLIVNGMILRLKPVAKRLLCEFRLFRARGSEVARKSRLKYSAIAVLILLEQLAFTLKTPSLVTPSFEAHQFYKNLYFPPHNFLANSKNKINSIKKNVEYRIQCLNAGYTENR